MKSDIKSFKKFDALSKWKKDMQKSVWLEDQRKYNIVRYIFREKKFPYASDFNISMNLTIIKKRKNWLLNETSNFFHRNKEKYIFHNQKFYIMNICL